MLSLSLRREVEVDGERDQQHSEHRKQQSEVIRRQLAHAARMPHMTGVRARRRHAHPRAWTVVGWGREATDSARLILAAKTAVAAAIAWYLAPLVPWADSEIGRAHVCTPVT